jgi:hypothetical protein
MTWMTFSAPTGQRDGDGGQDVDEFGSHRAR